MDDHIYVLDKSGILVDSYHNGRKSHNSQEVTGKLYWEAGFPSEMVKLLAKSIADLKKTKEVQSFDYQIEAPTGELWYSAKVSMRNDAKGNFDGTTIVSRNITDRKVFEEKLFYLSTHDTLTGIYNRAYFETELDRLARSRNFPATIVLADIDHLKRINDSRGSATGDKVLKLAATALLDAFRGEDLVARVGGDEFAVLLPNTDEETAQKVMQRAKASIAATKVSARDGQLKLSIGWAVAENGNDLHSAVKKADKRLSMDKVKKVEKAPLPVRSAS
jgi:diguanylate cyclase (GGDEF)-like protein